MDAEVYRLVVPQSNGEPMVVYVLPKLRHHAVRAMREEYGVVEVTPMMMVDLPEGVTFPEGA